MQHDKNDDAKYIGKTNMGAHGRRSGAEHFERHAAWERYFFKKMSATLHGSGGAEEAPRAIRFPSAPAPPHPLGNYTGTLRPQGVREKHEEPRTRKPMNGETKQEQLAALLP